MSTRTTSRRISQLWPQCLEQNRLDALAAVESARQAVYCALNSRWGDHSQMVEAAALSAACCRDCLRLVAAAADYRPPSGRWASRLVALRQLLDEHATVGLVLAQTAKGGRDGDSRRAALVELVEVLADIHFYLEGLARRHNGVSI